MENEVRLSLKNLRQRQGMTQKELAEKLQVSFQTISKWENGITMPDIAYLPKLSAIFGVSTDVLLGIKPIEDEEPWRRFDAYGYWNQHAERTKIWKRLYWNDDYFAFLVREVWQLHDPVRILDFGCGYGFLGMQLLPLLPEGSTYTGIDLDGGALEEARQFFRDTPWKTHFIQQDMYQYKPEQKYDIVIGLYLMTYLQRPDEILQKMKDSLAYGGKLILMDANMEVEQAGYYSCMEQDEGLERPDYTPVWKSEVSHRERDYRMGTKLPALLRSIGLVSIQARISDKVIIYDPEDEGKRELGEIFRYIHENKDSSLEGLSFYQSRGASYAEAAQYVDYSERTKKYFDSGSPYVISTSAIYFAWGELPEPGDTKEGMAMPEGQSKKRKLMNTIFILHPWGFVVFMLLGAGAFLYTATRIHIPVYTTVETVAEETGGVLRLDLHNKEFITGTPVFLYESRDDHLEKVSTYEMKEGWLLTEPIDTLPDSGRLYVDIQTGEISLLRHIFKEGGNSSS